MFDDGNALLKLILIVVGAIISVLALVFFLNSVGFINYSFFAPKYEQVRYNTFKESQSYNEGMLRDLQNLKLSYLQASLDQRVALKATVLQRFSSYQFDMLPPDLQEFYRSLNN